jgi:AcrR family transcriptional regulator
LDSKVNLEEENVKERIIRTSWSLFSSKGFDKTTLNDIITKANISKGTFYYYFRSKDTLLNTLSVIFDEEYRKVEERTPEELDSFEKLMFLNYEIHTYIGENIDSSLLASQYSAQLTNNDESNLLDKNRYYFTILTKIIEEGQRKNELRSDLSVSEMVRLYGLCERAIVTDWCMNNGSYSLGEYSRKVMPLLCGKFRAEKDASSEN